MGRRPTVSAVRTSYPILWAPTRDSTRGSLWRRNIAVLAVQRELASTVQCRRLLQLPQSRAYVCSYCTDMIVRYSVRMYDFNSSQYDNNKYHHHHHHHHHGYTYPHTHGDIRCKK
eukprot:scpid88394/ scgid26079/ 